MRARALTALAIALGLAGCSIFDAPDRDRLDAWAEDGGTDAYVEPDANDDAGFDSGVDGGPCAHAPMNEMVCADGMDDDCDGLFDCADPDCVISHASECCTTGGSSTTEHFNKTGAVWDTAGNWTAAPSMASAITAAGVLSQMGTGPLIGMVNNTCVHVDLGAEIRFTMTPTPCSGTDCAGRMEVVVGPSTSFGTMLTDDLAIRGTAVDPGTLQLDVVQGGTIRSTTMMSFGTTGAQVVVTLSPGIANGRNAIVGTVVATQGAHTETLADQLYVTDRDIFGTSSCHGLHLGVQGTGTHVGLDDVTITELDCSNPARFGAVRDDADAIDAVTMSVSSTDHTTGWGRGGIGDPALFEGVLAGTGATHRFTLLFDGSPVDRASDVIGHLPLSIGGADTTATGTDGLALIDDCSRWSPRGGNIACTPPTNATGHDLVESPLVMRDPTLYPDNRDPSSISSYRVAWVGETAPGSGLSLFVGLLDAAVPTRILGVPTATPITGDESCTSIRNPLLLPLLGTDSDWLLFYVCDSVFPPVVHAAQLETGTLTATLIDSIVLDRTTLGPLAATGVTDIAGVVFDYVTGSGPSAVHTPTYRLWLTARPNTTETDVLFVEGRAPPDSPTFPIPDFTPFAGNPVLTEQSPVFGSCGLGCQLHGITATRISNDPTRVRVLVERWVDTGSGLTYGLVPLEQTWPTDR